MEKRIKRKTKKRTMKGDGRGKKRRVRYETK